MEAKCKTIREAALRCFSINPLICVFNAQTGNNYYMGGYTGCPDNLKDLPLSTLHTETKGAYDIIYCGVKLS